MATISNQNSEGLVYTREYGAIDSETGVIMRTGGISLLQETTVNNAHILPQDMIDLIEYECPETGGGGIIYPTEGQLYPMYP